MMDGNGILREIHDKNFAQHGVSKRSRRRRKKAESTEEDHAFDHCHGGGRRKQVRGRRFVISMSMFTFSIISSEATFDASSLIHLNQSTNDMVGVLI
jgi:hypothetical protein